MAKRRTRAPQREPNRAELKAMERRATVSPPAGTDVAALAVDYPADGVGGVTSRSVLPTRASRLAPAGGALSREQELAYIRGDLRRLTLLTALMLAILAVLALVIR